MKNVLLRGDLHVAHMQCSSCLLICMSINQKMTDGKVSFKDKRGPKINQPYQMILALNLISLKFNFILILDSFQIQSNRDYKCNITLYTQMGCIDQRWAQVGLIELDCTCNPLFGGHVPGNKHPANKGLFVCVRLDRNSRLNALH